jgi:hypothetical protein
VMRGGSVDARDQHPREGEERDNRELASNRRGNR